jgi:hypothetical protein
MTRAVGVGTKFSRQIVENEAKIIENEANIM